MSLVTSAATMGGHGLDKRKNLVCPVTGSVMGLVWPLGELLQPGDERLNVSCNAKPGAGGAHESVT